MTVPFGGLFNLPVPRGAIGALVDPSIKPDVTDVASPKKQKLDLTKVKEEMSSMGIPRDQFLQAYNPVFSEAFANSILPVGYYGHEGEAIKGLYRGIKGLIPKEPVYQIPEDINKVKTPEELAARQDAWRLYLGLPQNGNTFSISDYQPSNSKENKYYFRLNRGFPDLIKGALKAQITLSVLMGGRQPSLEQELKGGLDLPDKDLVPALVVWLQRKPGKKALVIDPGVMGGFTFALGKDSKGSYVSYYDKWDLDKMGSTAIAGKPYEIYDRIYYDPKQVKRLQTERR